MSLHSTPEDRHAAFGDDWKPLDYPELVHPEPRADEPVVYDHKAEAQRLAKLVTRVYNPGTLPADTVFALAQVHATLALVEAQRTANLIAWYTFHPSPAIRERIGKELGI